MEIAVENLDHLGIVAGLIDEMGLVDCINNSVGRHPKEIVSPGQVVKAMILNGLGFVSAPLYLFEQFFVGKATFASTLRSFRSSWNFEQVELFVCDSALYSQQNLELLGDSPWLSRVPASLSEAKQLLSTDQANWLKPDESVPGYRIAVFSSEYAQVPQRWLLVESEARRSSDLDKLQQQLLKQQKEAQASWQKLSKQSFACEPDAIAAAERFASTLKLCSLAQIKVVEKAQYAGSGRPRKQAKPKQLSYFLQAQIVPNQAAIEAGQHRAGRFILATNVIAESQLSPQACLNQYKAQQSVERGFRFLKDPLFFTSRVFIKSHHRVAAMAMVMGLCLLVYSLGQRKLRQALARAGDTIADQRGKPTDCPTLRWVFQCFQAVHLLQIAGAKQIANLTEQRSRILNFLGAPCQKYYLLC
ncbi:hypothetical protein Pse7367_3629 [Thalassoporum mexicanum PCC 7367]|nr:IS1634 family transposase [Pseudanabaena sp. PCC 7367]AFY71862.1 hypothetical protein Pse7367_3629 [Pseudanabaena sp. PCC 7367]